MKNPFVAMAVMAAAMMEAFKENKYRDAGIPMPAPSRGSRGPVGKRNPAGSKFIMRAFKAKHGHKADSIDEARDWYTGYLRDHDAAARAVEAQKRQARTERNTVPLKLAA